MDAEELADSLALLACCVFEWGGGDVEEFIGYVAAGVDLAPAELRIATWSGWLKRAA